jgi:hypothetical protein
MNTLTQFAQYYTTQSTTVSTATPEELAAAAAILAVVIVISLIFAVLAYAISAWLLGRIFKKASIPQWIAWVPFYNSWKLLEMGDQKGFWAVLTIIPVVSYVSLVFMYIAMYKIGLKFGKEGWWVILAIFVPIVWIAILAFDSSKWNAEKPAITTA